MMMKKNTPKHGPIWEFTEIETLHDPKYFYAMTKN